MLVWSPVLLHQGSLLCSHFTIFTFIPELIEEKEKNEEPSEVEEKNHVKAEEKSLSCSQTKQRFKEKKRQEIFHLHSVWKEFHRQNKS